MSNNSGKHFLVVGNGPSLASIDDRRLDSSAYVVRVNNFFFESQYYTGKRVDLVQVGGDRWIFPFYSKTLKRVLKVNEYDIRGWSSHQPKVAKRGQTLLEEVPFRRMSYRDNHVKRTVERLSLKHRAAPTTGIFAVVNAHAMGAETITLAGIDFYEGSRRYAHHIGPRASEVVLAHKNYNNFYHSAALDVEIIDYLCARGDVVVQKASTAIRTISHLPLAPLYAEHISAEPKSEVINDWERWVGPWPLTLAKKLRRLREIQKYGARS
ncbi:alpha-2,3-sialyltransferase [Nitratireductor aquimarinus]|uniref:alpha-2,3-sialyltransferase n=1 Tax=Nitratireductor aquimarinus TaxID=889300 RepID=UPI002935F896|nr:alpha-2,3-sialyltransferase [Nitratireductor aquimarinus]MDV2968146.1 alpha-2,3-sialyltransferase [Nitratireductor aquimarinus]